LLSLFAACPTAKGALVEIGSYKGKSTVLLSKSSTLTSDGKVVAIDPLSYESIHPHSPSPAFTDETFFNDFAHNLKEAGVFQNVEFHRDYSYNVIKTWNRQIRFLWIDGDHSYLGVKKDFDLFCPFLEKGAIIAFHDVLHNFDGPIRVFAEDILLSNQFGSVGLCGSIGWAQYLKEPELTEKYNPLKMTLYKKLTKLIPYAIYKTNNRGFHKLTYKVLRACVPHSFPNPNHGFDLVQFINSARIKGK